MKIQSVFDKSFMAYGQIITGIDTTSLVNALETETPLPEGVTYIASEPKLEALSVMEQMTNNVYGGMPVQLGYCNGHNTMLNCLEYHRDSEINLGSTDFVLLLAKQECIIEGKLDTACVEAFLCPAGTMVEVYATSLHYAPCSAKSGEGFKVMVGLPKDTNTDMPNITATIQEDVRLRARNKWLLAHEDSNEAKDNAYIGLVGKNINISDLI